jgi:hypothetical protein
MEPESTNTREYGTPRPSLVRRTLRFVGRFSILLIVICSIGSYELGRSAVYREHPEFSGQEQASAILTKVGALTPLPSGETPTIATINDAASAKNAQPFLASAENGDVLIVYPNAAEALLYRPSTDKVIAVGPVDSSAGTPTIEMPTPELTATSTQNATSTKSKK